MGLFTAILRTGDGTHVTQVRGGSAQEAYRAWCGLILEARELGHPIDATLDADEEQAVEPSEFEGVWQMLTPPRSRPTASGVCSPLPA